MYNILSNITIIVSDWLSEIMLRLLYLYLVIKTIVCPRYTSLDGHIANLVYLYGIEPDFIMIICGHFSIEDVTIFNRVSVYPDFNSVYLPEARSDIIYSVKIAILGEKYV